MSNFLYKNPITPEQLNGAQSVSRTETFGTNFSVLGIGGFMEVYNITDLYFTIPPLTTGPIELSGNTVPINFLKGSGAPFSPDVLTLNSDNISSGRRRLGMLVYVYETDQVYQYQIDNFFSLWSAATGSTGVGGNTVVFSDFGTTVKNNSVAGQNFINAWTANTVDGISGNVRSNSVWKKYYGSNLSITGGTYDSFTGTLNLINITGGTVPITGISGGGGGGGITGGTFIYSAQTLELYSSGGTLSITGFADVYVTGGTYSAGTITFTNNSGGTFVVTGIPTGGGVSGDYLPLSGGTVSGNTIFTSGLTANTLNVTGNTTLTNTSGTSFYTNYIDFNLTATTPSSVSRLRYDSGEGGLVTTMVGGNIDLKIGQENVVYCFNGDTVNLTKGQVVAIIGNQGNRPKIQRAIASAETTSSTALGVVSETINVGNEGFVTTFGNVRGFQITGITPGSYVYLSPTVLGEFTGTQPQAPDHIVALGYVVRTGNTQGEIFVNINNGWEINELHNVRITNPTNNDILQLSAGTPNIWINVSNPTLNGLTVTGNTILQSLTATTISATTYQNLPVSAVTGGTGISASTNNGIVTIINTLPDQTVTISGGTGISTSGTYPSFIITNTGVTSISASASDGISANTTTGNVILINTRPQGITGITATDGLSANTTSFLTTIINTDKGSSQNIFKNIQINGVTQFSANSNNSNINFSGINISIISASTNTLVFSADTSGNGGLAYFISGSTPGGTINSGDRWFDTNSGLELVYVNDGDSSQWIQPNSSPGSFTGNTSATCISQLYVTNVYGCSPINFNDPVNLKEGATFSGITTFNGPVNINSGFTSNSITVTAATINGNLTVTGNTSLQGLTATTISATTYQNLPTDIRVTGATYSNNNFTFTNNTGGTFSVLFNTVTGLTVNGNITTTGTTTFGNGTFTKAGFATGDVLLDNNGTDTPGVLFYYANNSNYGIDSWNGSFDVLSGQLLRFTNKLNETGGDVKMAIDTTGNMVVGGFIKVNAWRAGQVVNDIMLSNTEVTISTTTIATSTSDTDFLTYSYTPLSSTSYLVIHYHLGAYTFNAGTGNDSYFSRIKVDGNEITYANQSTVNGNRTGVLFPLTGRYTNSNTTAKSIVVACRRDSADDSISIINSSTSMWLRITEIAR